MPSIDSLARCLLACMAVACAPRIHAPTPAPLDPEEDRREALHALAAHLEGAMRLQRFNAEHVIFADSISEIAAAPLILKLGLRVEVPPAVMVCPWNRSDGMRGYVVSVRLSSLSGDDAVGSHQVGCETDNSLLGRPQRYAQGCTTSLKRQAGRWVTVGSMRCFIT